MNAEADLFFVGFSFKSVACNRSKCEVKLEQNVSGLLRNKYSEKTTLIVGQFAVEFRDKFNSILNLISIQNLMINSIQLQIRFQN